MAQKAIDTAITLNGHIIAQGDATTTLKADIESSHKVSTKLTPQQRALLQSYLEFEPLFAPSKTITHDHPVLYALRELIRLTYTAEHKLMSTPLRTVVVGSAWREVKKYDSNPAVHFYFHNTEGKDADRIIVQALSALATEIRKRLGPDAIPLLKDNVGNRRVIARYNNLQGILKDYKEIAGKHDRYHLSVPRCNLLVLEDSFYNLQADDYLKLFEKSGAMMAVGYGFLPLELLYRDMPENALYRLVPHGDRVSVVYNNGYSNGYDHKRSSWATLLKSPVIIGPDFNLVTEITSRIGPMVAFKITKTFHSETIVRSMDMPRGCRFVRVLDLYASVNHATGRLLTPLVYFSAFEDEFFELVNWLLGIAEASMTPTAATMYIRRRARGTSLAPDKVISAWHLDVRDYYRTAYAAWMYANSIRKKMEVAVAANPTDAQNHWFKDHILGRRGLLAMFSVAWEAVAQWLSEEDLTDKLVLFTEDRQVQRVRTRTFAPPAELCALTMDQDPDALEISCPFCFSLDGRVGKQKILCNYKESVHKFVVTDEDWTELHVELIDNDDDPIGLKNVKERAAMNLLSGNCEHECQVSLLTGGPGTGKSTIARLCADPDHDMIYAPFTKLKADYEKVAGADGLVKTWCFQTTHRGTAMKGKKVLYVDEFTALDYRYLAWVVNTCKPREVVLMGDAKQTKIRGDEGIYIGSKIPLEEISRHELLGNFRNTREVVALMNRDHGYQMEAMRDEVEGFALGPGPTEAHHMAFSKRTCDLKGVDGQTVRANQGGTHDVVNLYVNGLDGDLPMATELRIVALSRSRSLTHIDIDDSDVARNFVLSLALEELRENMAKYLPTHTLPERKEKRTCRVVYDLLAEGSNHISAALAGDDEGPVQIEKVEVIETNTTFTPLTALDAHVQLETKWETDVSGTMAGEYRRYKLGRVCRVMGNTYKGAALKMGSLLRDVVADHRPTTAIFVGEAPGKGMRVFHDLYPSVPIVVASNRSYERNEESVGVRWLTNDINEYSTKETLARFAARGKCNTFFSDLGSDDGVEDEKLVVSAMALGLRCVRSGLIVVKTRQYSVAVSCSIRAAREIAAINVYVSPASNPLGRECFIVLRPKKRSIFTSDVKYSTTMLAMSRCKDLDEEYETKSLELVRRANNNIFERAPETYHNYCVDLAAVSSWISSQVMADNVARWWVGRSIARTRADGKISLIGAACGRFSLLTTPLPYADDHECERRAQRKKEHRDGVASRCESMAVGFPRQDLIIQWAVLFLFEALACTTAPNPGLDDEDTDEDAEVSDDGDDEVFVYTGVDAQGTNPDGDDTDGETTDDETDDGGDDDNDDDVDSDGTDDSTDPGDDSSWATTDGSDDDQGSDDFGYSPVRDSDDDEFAYQRGEILDPEIYGALVHDVVPSDTPDALAQADLEYVEDVHAFLDFIPESVQALPDVATENVVRQIEQIGYDSYQVADTLAEINNANTPFPSQNWISGSINVSSFDNGTIAEDFFAEVNQRGHVKPAGKKYRAFGPGAGNHYTAYQPFQTLATIAHRYAGKKRRYPFDVDAKTLAKMAVDEFFLEHCKESQAQDPIDASVLYKEFTTGARTKHYEAMYMGESDFDIRTIRFHLKDIFKPAKPHKPTDVNKVGQGISAWSKRAHIKVSVFMRILNERFLLALKDHAVYDNRMTEDEVRDRVSKLMESTPDCSMNVITDVKECDAKQNAFTQAIEREFMARLGATDEFIEFYYTFREHYVLQSSSCRACVDWSKTSGEAGTLLLNTAVCAVISNFLVRCQNNHAVVLAMKGDDGFKRGVEPKIDLERKELVAKYCDFQMDIMITDAAEFCGNTIYKGEMIASIPRKLSKLLGHRFRSYKHFTEYQAGLRDWVEKFEGEDLLRKIFANSILYGVTPSEAEAAYAVVKSVSHIDEAQYEDMTQEYEETAVLVTADLDVVVC